MPAAQPDSPVSLIEGIGPAIERRLQQIGVYFVFDLLRAAAEQVHAGLTDVASLDQVRAWRSMAALLQIRVVTERWAEALAKGGVSSIEDLHRRSHDEISALFATAHGNGVIAAVPDETTIWSMQLDAAVLRHTGILNLTLRDPDGSAIAGAQVRLGTFQTASDARGRVRFNRIPLGPSRRLIVTHQRFATLEIDAPPADLDEQRVSVTVLQLLPAVPNQPAASRLSEYDGDELPAWTEFGMTTDTRERAAVREGDVFMLRKFYDDGVSAQLTSKFLEYENGRFIAASYRVPRAELPLNARERSHFAFRRGVFTQIRMNSARLRAYKAMRRARRALHGHAPPQTWRERDQALREYADAIVAARRGLTGGLPR